MSTGRPTRLAVLALALAALPAAAQVTLYGTLANFDVVNDTGSPVHGLEIEFHGASNIYSYYNSNRYGAPQVVPFPNGGGVYVRWMSPYDANRGIFVTATPAATKPTVLTGHQCIIGTQGYATSGCEHFGISVVGNASRTIYRWLIADPANPGKLIPRNSTVAIPAPIWSVQPPARPADPPIVQADVDPPVPPAPAKRFGDAQWMKTYKTENRRQVILEELVADDPVVPEDPAEIETEWELLQNDAADIGGGGKRKRKRGALGGGNKAVVRRFELYKFTGTYDPITNQAICLDGLCNAPDPTEVGDFIGAQNAAANLNGPDFYPVTVTIAGDGQVEDSARAIRCPGTCSLNVKAGDPITLTARNGKGTFSGWTGPCAGSNSLTCTFTVNSDAPITATFKSSYKLVLKTNGSGTASSNPAGSTFLQGTPVTVTANPAAGATWKGWTGGGCSGLSLSCTVTINADTTLTANFR
ncbi:MAG: hypothetical protein JNK87_01260 [Bryobacterales bacterium]|nr:hypothetical protein [Bryobacterales bacterium]